MRTSVFKEKQNQKDILQIENELVDTLGNHLVFNDKKYYILDFSYRDCRPCRIKLDFLKRFSKESPSNLQIVYISPSIAETYKYFKENLTHENDDKIIYAYLNDNVLLKKMGITLFPREIFIGPDLKILRFKDGFQESDESFYKENTLKFINNAQ
nr:thioredoxin-like domain-containing protein [Mucilaginibacter ginkgonis]